MPILPIPSPSKSKSERLRPSGSASLHSLQIRAFLNASEDVVVDQDTVKDLLEGLDSEDEQEDATDDDDDGNSVDEEDNDLDISALYTTDQGGK